MQICVENVFSFQMLEISKTRFKTRKLHLNLLGLPKTCLCLTFVGMLSSVILYIPRQPDHPPPAGYRQG